MTLTAERAIATLLERLRTEAPHTCPELAGLLAARLMRLPDPQPQEKKGNYILNSLKKVSR